METLLEMKTISASELRAWKNSGKVFQLIDIREEHEVADHSIGGKHIPMAQILERSDELRRDIPVIIHCHSGKRSSAVVYALEKKWGFDNIFSLEGGLQSFFEGEG